MRATVRILIVIAVVGTVGLFAGYHHSATRAEREALQLAEELLDTVEPTARIASYLNDEGLATEVVRGLLNHPVIASVEVLNSEQGVLSSRDDSVAREGSHDPAHLLERAIESPFSEGTQVGTIRVRLSEGKLRREIFLSTLQLGVPMLAQAVVGGLCLVCAIFFFFLPKSRELMHQIGTIHPDRGETLSCPPAEKRSEIGVLTAYINGLIVRAHDSLVRERSLREQHELERRKLQSIFESSTSGIFLATGQGRLTSSNAAFQRLLECGASELAECNVFEMLSPAEAPDFVTNALQRDTEVHFNLDRTGEREDEGRWLQAHLVRIDADTVQGVVNDISRIKAESIAAHNMARTDPLTQLGNRLAFSEKLDELMDSNAKTKYGMALMLIDLDKFKAVNDSLGHGAGDEVLKVVAERLQTPIRKSDFAARLGGDEFGILLRDVPMSEAERVAAHLVESLARPIVVESGEVAAIGGSVGVVRVAPEVVGSTKALIALADEKMYEIKKGGRNGYRVTDFSGPNTALRQSA